MATIKQLSEADIVENGDQFPFFSEAQGDARKVTFATLKDGVVSSLAITPCTVAQLAPPAGVGAGYKWFVSDSTVTASGNFGTIVAGGGVNAVPVYSDGTNWRIG